MFKNFFPFALRCCRMGSVGDTPSGSDPGTVNLTSLSISRSEGGTFRVIAERVDDFDGEVRVDFAIGGGLGSPSSGTLIWGNGVGGTQQSALITCSQVSSDQQDNITLSVNTESPATPALGVSTTTLDVTNVPSSLLTLRSIDVVRNEGETFKVIADRFGSFGEVRLDWVVSDGLGSPSSGTMIWLDGESGLLESPDITAQPVDSDQQGTITISVNPSSPIQPSIVTDETSLDIMNVPVAGTINLTSLSITRNEGEQFTVSAERVNGSEGEVSALVTVGDSLGSPVTQILTWGDGVSGTQTTGNFTAAQVATDQQTDITLTVNSGNPTLGVDTTTLDVDNVPQPGNLSISSSAVNVLEGDTFDVTVARSGGTDGIVAVNVVVGGSLATDSPKTATFPAGNNTPITLTFQSAGVTGNQTNSATLTDAGSLNGASIVSPNLVGVTVRDASVSEYTNATALAGLPGAFPTVNQPTLPSLSNPTSPTPVSASGSFSPSNSTYYLLGPGNHGNLTISGSDIKIELADNATIGDTVFTGSAARIQIFSTNPRLGNMGRILCQNVSTTDITINGIYQPAGVNMITNFVIGQRISILNSDLRCGQHVLRGDAGFDIIIGNCKMLADVNVTGVENEQAGIRLHSYTRMVIVDSLIVDENSGRSSHMMRLQGGSPTGTGWVYIGRNLLHGPTVQMATADNENTVDNYYYEDNIQHCRSGGNGTLFQIDAGPGAGTPPLNLTIIDNEGYGSGSGQAYPSSHGVATITNSGNDDNNSYNEANADADVAAWDYRTG